MKTFYLPDLGEGLPDAEIVKWHVAVGDEVALDQLLVSVETAKAMVEVPSPVAGVVSKLHAQPGEVVKTNQPLVDFSADVDSGTVVGEIKTSQHIIDEKPQIQHGAVKTTPAVRAIAKKLHVDLTKVTATGPDNTITRKDVELASKNKPANDLKSITGVQRSMALTMQKSHQEIVPVTVSDDAIVTNYRAGVDITVHLMRAIHAACKKEPELNAWFYGDTLQKKLLDKLRLGVAIDTGDGLFVPAIDDLSNKSDQQLRTELNELKKQAATRTLSLESLQGASFVLSNFGKFAGRFANPIIVPPMVAILATGRMRQEVVALEKPEIAWVLPLSLTFDHRACTGAQAARFLGVVMDYLYNVVD